VFVYFLPSKNKAVYMRAIVGPTALREIVSVNSVIYSLRQFNYCFIVGVELKLSFMLNSVSRCYLYSHV